MRPADDTTRPDSDERLKELILYVSDRCELHPRFGATKLNKILFYADFVAYAKLGRPITGTEYQRLPQGPAPRRLLPLKAQLIANREAVEREKHVYSRIQKRIIPLREADLSRFTADEISIVDRVIGALEGKSADDVSELSHQFPGWELAEDRETIPYHTALIPPEDWEPDQEILDHGSKLAATL
jgi:Protein of unknown function (DUF4065)